MAYLRQVIRTTQRQGRPPLTRVELKATPQGVKILVVWAPPRETDLNLRGPVGTWRLENNRERDELGIDNWGQGRDGDKLTEADSVWCLDDPSVAVLEEQLKEAHSEIHALRVKLLGEMVKLPSYTG